jgi:hypothetical protein
MRLLVDRLHLSEEELGHSDLVMESHQSILRLNVEHLVSALGRGGVNQLAEGLKVDRTTIFGWKTGRQQPNLNHQFDLLNYFGLPPSVSLEWDPLFLSDQPFGEPAMKRWLHDRVDMMDLARLQKYFPAIEILLTSQ